MKSLLFTLAIVTVIRWLWYNYYNITGSFLLLLPTPNLNLIITIVPVLTLYLCPKCCSGHITSSRAKVVLDLLCACLAKPLSCNCTNMALFYRTWIKHVCIRFSVYTLSKPQKLRAEGIKAGTQDSSRAKDLLDQVWMTRARNLVRFYEQDLSYDLSTAMTTVR